MKTTYEKALKEYFVKQFILKNHRSPNTIELVEGLRNLNKEFVDLNNVGFSGNLIKKPGFASESSVETENLNREALFTDVKLGYRRLTETLNTLENVSRGFFASTRNITARLSDIEARLDNMLLFSNQSDLFVYGIEENFTVQDKIDFTNTTASVENGFVTLGRDGFELIDISDVDIKYSTFAEKGYSGIHVSSNVNTLKSDDGNFWEYLVYTSYKNGRVSALINITLNEPQFVSQFRFTNQMSGINTRPVANLFYTLDGLTYKQVEPYEYVITTAEVVFNIGIDNVKGFRLILSKNQYDASVTNDQYVYIFSLDSIKLYSNGYLTTGESLLYAGPYSIADEDGNPIKYTKATADVCVTKGNLDGVSLFLSKDGEEYIPVNTDGTGLAVVTFANSANAESRGVLNEEENANSISSDNFIDLLPNEAISNTIITTEYASSYIRKSIVFKRNVPIEDTNGNRIQVYGVDSGWFFDSASNLYKTTIYVTNPLGFSINLGNTSAFVNGVQVSGLVNFKPGYSVFETAASNWSSIPKNIGDFNSLKRSDIAYPYNHKYLIEGYIYPDTFKGEKVYIGVEEYFGMLCSYQVPELFIVNDSNINYGIYTIDHKNNYGIFKIKVNKSDSTWSNEQCVVNWYTNSDGYENIWMKMRLQSSIAHSSPVVTSVKIRVI